LKGEKCKYLDFIEQPEEAPAGEAEPHAQRTLTAEEQPREGGFMARLLSWLGLN